NQKGALVSEVAPGGPADKAGFKQGDVVTALDGRPITDAHSLRMAVSAIAPGTRVNLDIIRDGRNETLTTTIGERKPEREGRLSGVFGGGRDEGVLNGVAVDDIDPNTRAT